MSLPFLRKEIDGIDKNVLELLAKRFTIAEQIGHHKTMVQDVAREKELRHIWKLQAEALSLSPTFAMALLDLILGESHRIQSTSLQNRIA